MKEFPKTLWGSLYPQEGGPTYVPISVRLSLKRKWNVGQVARLLTPGGDSQRLSHGP